MEVSMYCKKCNASFPNRLIVDGKVRHLQNRKFCLTCSPFGSHNTKNLIEFDRTISVRSCVICGKEIVRKNRLRSVCWTCANRKSRNEKINKIQKLVGVKCWKCNYDVCWQAMDFHHVNPDIKLFPLTTRELQFGWDKIELELRKCVLLCCRCHREYHAGLISNEKILDLWQDWWAEK